MVNKILEEYQLLTDKLDEVQWALEGECNDIDCDKYMYKDLLKKKYKPVLQHGFSCMEALRREKVAIIRILSQKRYKKDRNTKCAVCKKMLDKLSEKSAIVSFTRPVENSKYHELKLINIHRKCSKRVKAPIGWKKSL